MSKLALNLLCSPGFPGTHDSLISDPNSGSIGIYTMSNSVLDFEKGTNQVKSGSAIWEAGLSPGYIYIYVIRNHVMRKWEGERIAQSGGGDTEANENKV